MPLTTNSADIPGFPGVVRYHISGESYETVQNEINRLFRQIETVNGCAEMSNPRREGNGYVSSGYYYVEPETLNT